ncbi:lipopolysaccharide biosynthesis protein, partial [Vibrio vulnificus]|nr:lipopolysaccharide biosynthesis protein [Vibrio vulnificus]
MSLSWMPSITSILAASVMTHLVQVIWLQRLCRLPLIQPKAAQILDFILYSIPIALSGMVAFLMNGAERWVIATTDTIESLAFYAIAAKFALALCILVQPFGMWWMPKRFSVYLREGAQQAARITQYGLVWIAMLAAGIAYFAP